MPPGEETASGARSTSLVIWRLGGALLAVPLEATVEVAAVEGDEALSRAGRLEPRVPPGLELQAAPTRAVVVRSGDALLALAADEVEGVSAGAATAGPTPPWLRRLPLQHLAGLARLPDGRVAAVLDPAALAGP